jgi:hypothetical protein
MPGEPTPDTLAYLMAGYAAFWVLSFAFVFSLWARTRNLEKDIEVLRQLVDKET